MRQITIIISILSAVVLSHGAEADDAATRSPELQVLDNFVGTWDLKVTVKPTGQEAVTGELVSYRKWSKGGRFVLFDTPGVGDVEFILALTYDTDAMKYVGVTISSDPGVVTATWDDDTKTMHFVIKYVDGPTYTATHRFIRRDYAEWFGKVTNEEGDVVEMSNKETRRKK